MNIARLLANDCGKKMLTSSKGFNLFENSSVGLERIVGCRRGLHANRASICRIKRPQFGYCRQFPVRIVFQDGSSIVARHTVPREIIKMPLLLEDCRTNLETKQWLSRRKPKDIIHIEKDDTAVSFNQMDYIRNLKQKSATKKTN